MSGILIVGGLLRADDAVTQLVLVDLIRAARLPDNAELPTLLVRTISAVDRQPLKRGGFVTVTERVSVTVRAKSYDSQRAIIKAARLCCAGKTGTIAGFRGVSILTAGMGPDLAGPGDSFEQAQDFSVTFQQPN